MKLTRTSIIWLFCGVILLCAGTAFSFNKDSSSFSKRNIEKALETILGVDVSIGSVIFSSEKMQAQVLDIQIGNPPNFKNGPAITVEQIDIDIRSLGPEKLVLKNVAVQGTVFYVDTNDKTVNLAALLRSIAHQRDNDKNPTMLQGNLAIEHVVMTKTQTQPANVTAAIAHGLSSEALAEDHMHDFGTHSTETAQRILTSLFVNIIDLTIYAADKEGYLEALPPENRPVTRHPR